LRDLLDARVGLGVTEGAIAIAIAVTVTVTVTVTGARLGLLGIRRGVFARRGTTGAE
jgi:hypothetical protein